MFCSPTDWSAVSSATANTALAGVLAGFMLNGIVVLLSRQPDDAQRAGYVKAAGLLFAGLVALGLDAYLFGLVTGNSAAGDACRKAWTEAMFAAGLLGIGAVSVITGIIFLLGVFFPKTAGTGGKPPAGTDTKHQSPGGDHKDPLIQSMNMLARLCTLLRVGVASVVILLFYMTTKSYLYAIFTRQPPYWMKWLLRGALWLDVVVIVVFMAVSQWGKGRTPRKSGTKIFNVCVTMDFSSRHPFFNASLNFVWNILQPDVDGEVTTLKTAIYASVIYSLGSVVATSVAVLPSAGFWDSNRPFIQFLIASTIVWVMTVSAVPLMFLLAPAFGPKRHDTA